MLTVVVKAWGRETWHVNTELYCLKELRIFAGQRCSLHRHHEKDETFIVREGAVIVQLGRKRRTLMPGDSLRVKPGEWHRFGSVCGGVLLEVSTHHDDGDVERNPCEPSGPLPESWRETRDRQWML